MRMLKKGINNHLTNRQGLYDLPILSFFTYLITADSYLGEVNCCCLVNYMLYGVTY